MAAPQVLTAFQRSGLNLGTENAAPASYSHLHNSGPPTRLPLRIAVLECDTPLTQTRAKYGGYGGVFKTLLHSGAAALPDLTPADLHITTWDVVTAMAYPDPEEIDAILITGSRYDSFADNEWTNRLVDFTARMLAHGRVRVLGVCYGHQIVGRALGAPVGRCKEGWEAAVTLVTLTEPGARLFGKDVLAIHQMHRDVVAEYPAGVQPLGSSHLCHVQGMYDPRRLLTVQGHPEFGEQIVSEILQSRVQLGIFSKEVFESAMARVALDHDGVLVAQAFLRFLLED